MVLVLLLMIVVMAAVVLVLLPVMILFVVIVMMRAIHRIALLVGEFLRMLIVMMVMMRLLGSHHLCENLTLQVGFPLNGLQNGLSVELRQGCCDDGCLGIVLADQGNRFIDLLLRGLVGPCQENRPCILNLVHKELAEILEINPGLCGIHHRYGAVQLQLRQLCRRLLNGPHHIIQLADSRGLDQNSLRRVGRHNLPERRIEISDQRAADAAGIHLADFNAGLLQKAAVDTDFSELILNEDHLRPRQRVRNELADQCGLAGSQKAGNNIYLCHLPLSFLLQIRSAALRRKSLLTDFSSESLSGISLRDSSHSQRHPQECRPRSHRPCPAPSFQDNCPICRTDRCRTFRFLRRCPPE